MAPSPGSERRPGPRGAAAPAHGEARELLLAAAARLFSQHGFDGVTVRQIAAEAGVGHAGVNYHFRSKSELYLEVLRRHGPAAALARAGVEPLPKAPGTFAEARAALIRWVAAFVAEGALPDDPIVDGLIRHEVKRPGGPRDEVFEGVIRPRHAELKALIAAMVPRMDDTDLSIAAIGVLAQAAYYRLARPVALRLLEVEQIDQGLAERIVSRVLANTLGGLALPPQDAGAAHGLEPGELA
jgi:AcrR family transcriptional regulator